MPQGFIDADAFGAPALYWWTGLYPAGFKDPDFFGMAGAPPSIDEIGHLEVTDQSHGYLEVELAAANISEPEQPGSPTLATGDLPRDSIRLVLETATLEVRDGQLL